MTFITRQLYPKGRTKLYFHQTGYTDAFGGTQSTPDTRAGRNYTLDLIEDRAELLRPADFTIAVLWGDGNVKVIELFGYGGISEWPGNPEVYSWVFEDGVHKPKKRQISCGDSLIILGEEEQLRRRTKDLQEYLSKLPPSVLF